MRILSLLIIGVLLTACSKGISVKQDEKLTLLEMKLDSALNYMNSIDTAKSLISANHFFDNMAVIQNEMSDTISRELAFFIDDYYALRKSLKLFGTSYPEAISEIKISKNQLSNFRTDLENGLISKEEFDKYYKLESANLNISMQVAGEVFRAIEYAQPLYDQLNPRIDSLVNSIKSEGQVLE